MTEQRGPYIQSHANLEVINLGLGQPSPLLLPMEEIAGFAAQCLGPGADRLVLQYGVSRGHPEFRSELAAMLTESGMGEATSEHLTVTGGISLSLSMVSQVFATRRRAVVCGDPTYFLARGIFETQGLEVTGISVDADGLVVAELEEKLSRGLEIDLVYVIPTFHNPTGTCLAADRAERLVELAEAHDFLIVADEPYGLLHFGGPRPGMMTYDRGRERVLSLGSFSKILGPGLRLGWLQTSPDLIARFLRHGTFRSGGGLNPLVAGIVHRALGEGFLRAHVERLRTTFRARASALGSALRSQLPELAFQEADGGYFLWVDLGEARDSSDLAERGRGCGVTFTPGSRCAVDRDLSRFVRFSFSFYSESELELGITRLATLLDR